MDFINKKMGRVVASLIFLIIYFLEISSINVKIGYKIASVATVEKQVMKIRIKSEYSARKFLKIIHTTSAHIISPHIFKSVISKIKYRCQS